MPAFLILFFWMLSILSGKDVQSENRPGISIKPHRALSLGDNGTVICEGPLFTSVHFYLEKDGQEISSKKGLGGNIDFPITNANREHGGMYTCYYKESQSKTKLLRSDPVELLIRDPALPRPSIYLYPSRIAVLGGNVTILCLVEGPSKSFYLHRGEDETTMELYKEGFAFLFIGNIDWDDGRSYQCSYSSQSGFFVSEPSNPDELLIVDPKFPRPSIYLSPADGVTVGGNVTIDCRSQETPKNFYLRMPTEKMTDEPMETDGIIGTFLISNVSLDRRGNYSCSYQPKSEPFSVSEPSDPGELLITDPDLLRPTISMRPTGIARLRSNVTIYCSTNGSFVTFHLYKSGNPMTSQPMETDGDMAIFSINNVSVDDSGVYHCCYRPMLKPFFISKPSNHMELLVLDPSLHRPEISIISRGLAVLGGQVKIRCETEEGPVHFFLYKDGDPTLKWPMESKWDVGEFSFSNISWEHQGNYSCSYALSRRPSAFSAHSDPMELLVSDSPDLTLINILHLATGGLILLLLAYIVIGDHHFWKEQWIRGEAAPPSSIPVSLSFPNKK